MCRRSIAMQAARAKASACIGDGPADAALSSVIWISPDLPDSTRSCSQINSSTTGGLVSAIGRFYALRWPVMTKALPLTLAVLAAMTMAHAQQTGDAALITRARALHKQVPLIDGHNDYPWAVRENVQRDIDKLDIA